MRVATLRFGALEVAPESEIDFPCGLPGFERERRFTLLEPPALAPLIFLQSLDTPGLCLPTVRLQAIAPEYQLELNSEDLRTLAFDAAAVPDAAQMLCLAVVVMQNGPPAANLLAPIVIHLARRLGVQAVRSDARYSHRHVLGSTQQSDAASNEVQPCS